MATYFSQGFVPRHRDSPGYAHGTYSFNLTSEVADGPANLALLPDHEKFAPQPQPPSASASRASA